MKKIESIVASIAALGFMGTVLLAFFWVGNAIYQSATAPEPPAIEITSAAQDSAPQEDTASAGDAAPAGGEAQQVAAVDLKAGEKVFRKCKACHTIEQGGKNTTGPNLWSVVGRQVASVADFSYSDPMAAMSDQAWEVELLESFLTKPKDVVPGTKMAFAGLNKEEDRVNLIAYLGQNADTPQSAEELGLAVASAGGAAASGASEGDDADAELAESEEVVIDEVPYPEDVTYANPPARTDEEQAAIDERVAALQAEVDAGIDYERARFHPLHFPPQAAEASNEECLVCHQEILEHEVREASLAGVAVDATYAWYQTLDTYQGDQQTFHYRHLESDFAKQVMNLECSFCHKGNDPREESPDMVPGRDHFTAEAGDPEFALRKHVNPSETCLRCHGAFPDPVEIMGLGGPWHEVREDLEWPEAPNGCLSCHAETFRTNRHAVTYLNAENIEEIARAGSSDSCYGCHGGRAWYRTSYPYPRHAWPYMDEETPEWAEGRPTESDPEYQLSEQAAAE